MNPLKSLTEKKQRGIYTGIPSYCTSNSTVINSLLKYTAKSEGKLLLEATANQVNQFGGYTGMKPGDFKKYIESMAAHSGVKAEQLLLGGDHLGPLIWKHECERDAMEKAEELVKEFAAAGFIKIHLDTSMCLGGDGGWVSKETVARRGVQLYRAAIEGYEERKRKVPHAIRPVFVIGSEVPVPGGSRNAGERVNVTSPEELKKTVQAYDKAFEEAGFENGMKDVIAVVVQPGVEFGGNEVSVYQPERAKGLSEEIKLYENLVLEGHSTDYQPPKALRKMVEDGVGVLKVGPALTFAMREAFFSLSDMEKILIPKKEWADVPGVLEKTMKEYPDAWNQYYFGTEQELLLERKFSLSDRSRYYMGRREIRDAVKKLKENIDKSDPPLGLIDQYFPGYTRSIIEGTAGKTAEDLIDFNILKVVRDYEYACTEQRI